MQSRLYITRDTVAQDIFGGIIRVNNDEVARRHFHDALSDERGPFKGHEADYELLLIGTIDETGQINEYSPSVIARGADWIAANNTISQKPELLK